MTFSPQNTFNEYVIRSDILTWQFQAKIQLLQFCWPQFPVRGYCMEQMWMVHQIRRTQIFALSMNAKVGRQKGRISCDSYSYQEVCTISTYFEASWCLPFILPICIFFCVIALFLGVASEPKLLKNCFKNCSPLLWTIKLH